MSVMDISHLMKCRRRKKEAYKMFSPEHLIWTLFSALVMHAFSGSIPEIFRLIDFFYALIVPDNKVMNSQ